MFTDFLKRMITLCRDLLSNIIIKFIVNRIIKSTKENLVIVTSETNFYQAAQLAISQGEQIKLFGQNLQSDYDFTNVNLEVGRREYLRFLNDLAGANAANEQQQKIQEFYEKTVILDVLQSADE